MEGSLPSLVNTMLQSSAGTIQGKQQHRTKRGIAATLPLEQSERFGEFMANHPRFVKFSML